MTAFVLALGLLSAAPRQTPADAPPVVASPAPGVVEQVQPPAPAPLEAPPDAANKPLFTAGWDNGFLLRSEDKRFLLRITGQIQTDYKNYLDQPDTADLNTFLVRRARLGIEATVMQYFEFRLLPDFGQGQARIQDSYLNVHYVDAFQIEAGKFKQPFSYEQLIQDRFVPTMERSLIDQLVPARDVGAMIHGQKLFGDRLDYAVAVHDGVINGDTDTNNPKDVSARLALRPFPAESFGPWLRGLQFGVAVNTGVSQQPVAPTALRTPAGVPWFSYAAGVREDGRRNRWSPELAYFNGPFGMAAQYLSETQRLRSATGPVVEIPESGFYVLATLLLTGEERTTYSQAVTPRHDFDPCYPVSSPGAWELVMRTSRLVQSARVFAPGVFRLADPAANSAGATELTTGFNWYLNAWVRVQCNWERAWFDQPVRLAPGPAGLHGYQDTLMTRFQVIF
jgi:phosphate-selective porin OprO/OprP